MTLQNKFDDALAKFKQVQLSQIPLYITVPLIASCIIVVGLLVFNKNINASLNLTDNQNISAMASQEQAALNGVIKNTVASLTSITKTLVTLQEDSAAQVKFLENVEKSLSFDSIILSDIHGRGIRSTKQEVKVKEHPAFIKAMQGDVYARRCVCK